MCTPALLLASGVGISAIGQIQQGRAAKAQADFQSQIAQNNAIIASRNSEDAIARGKISSGEQGLRTRQLISRQRAALAARGQEVDTGTALEITSDTAALGKLDSLRIINNSEREAAGFDIQSDNFISEASAQTASGRNSLNASRVQAFGTLLTGASSVHSKWKTAKE